MEALAVSRKYFKHAVVEIWSKIQKGCLHLPQQLFVFFSNPNKTSWHLYGRRAVTKGTQFHGRRITMGAPNHYVGAKKSKQCHKYFLQSSAFSSTRPQIRTLGRQTCFLPRALSNLVTPLYARVSCTCDKVWVSSPHWWSLLRMWLPKLLQLSPRSVASIWWEKLLYTSKTI